MTECPLVGVQMPEEIDADIVGVLRSQPAIGFTL